jgi:hypothetical protein
MRRFQRCPTQLQKDLELGALHLRLCDRYMMWV